MPDRLRPLWDFGDLDATERRFREQLEREESPSGRAEVLSQLARIEGLRGDFAACGELLDEAEPLVGSDPAANIRLELERGRMYRSSDDLEAAYPLFQSAFSRAEGAGEHYLAGDAAHMCAIGVTDRKLQEEWTKRGLDYAEREPEAAYWAGPLLNNLGWTYSDAKKHDAALEVFERALEVRKRDPENTAGIAWAQYAVAYELLALDRAAEAVPLLEQAAEALPDEADVRQDLERARSGAS
jgi:tetratricopeptide (TPR) repeat protein